MGRNNAFLWISSPPSFSIWKPHPLPHLSCSLLPAPLNPALLVVSPGGQRRRTEPLPHPRCLLDSRRTETRVLMGREGVLGPDPSRGGHGPTPPLFLEPCSPLGVRVCSNFLYGKMDKKKNREREVFNCNKLAPCGPALSVCVFVHLRCGEGSGGLCRAPGDRASLCCPWLCACPGHPARPGPRLLVVQREN